MGFTSSVLEAVIEELERDLGQRHRVIVQDRQFSAGFLGEQVDRPVSHLPLDDGLQDAVQSLRRAVPVGEPLLLMPSWEGRSRPGRITPLARTIREVLTAFDQHPVTAVIPASLLQSRRPHDRVAAFLGPPSVVVGFEGLGGEFGLHAQFAIGLVHLRLGSDVTRFFKVFGPTAPDDLASDFRRLLGQGGGQTRYGFVRRQRIPVDQPLWPDYWSPVLEEKIADLGAVGETMALSRFAEVKTLIQRAGDAHRLGRGIPVIGGRNISRHGEIDLEDVKLVEAEDDRRLQPGDILVRRIQDLERGPLVTAAVEATHLPASADDSVLVVRPNPDLDPLQVEFLTGFLRSPTARAVLRSRGGGPHVHVSDLLDLPIPTPDEATKTAVAQLRSVQKKLRGWADEADTAVGDLMQFVGRRTAEARTRLFAVGAISQRRVDAADMTEDLSWQIRNLYPHPIAYCFRTVEAGKADFEGYRGIIRCAEMALAYVAFATMAIIRGEDGLRLPHTAALASRQRERGESRLSMGDYLQVVRQVSGRESRGFARLERWIPLEEIRDSYNEDVDAATSSLKDRRDSQSHFRDEADLTRAYDDARQELDILMGSLRFLADYALRFIEESRTDTFADHTIYRFRELAGDHPLVPLQSGRAEQGPLEPGSLYLLDRRQRLHLLRPFMLRSTCPTCGRPGTFHLDSYRPDVAQYRSFEHGHTLITADEGVALRAVGLLPDP